MNTCTCCKGSGVKRMPWLNNTYLDLECPLCEGSGVYAEEDSLLSIETNRDLWCKCSGLRKTKFVDKDIPGALIKRAHKIHARKSCNKLVEVCLERHAHAS